MKTRFDDVAVLLPCRNEASTIGDVVREFSRVLPGARIYVYDNGSTDQTAEIAQEAGALVYEEPLKGKGNVVRRMFADIEADFFVLCDGDGTYPVDAAPIMIERLQDNCLDMVTGVRVTQQQTSAYPLGHQFGNRFLTRTVALLFGNQFSDMLSGFRVFSRRFVKSFPALSRGFEIETEFTIHSLELRIPSAELPVRYQARPSGSSSKLRTIRDGTKILLSIFILLKETRPFFFFGTISAALSLTAIALAWPLFLTYLETGLVPRFPTAILVTGMMVTAFLSLFTGILLDSVSRGRKEAKRLHYLAIKAPMKK